MKKTKLLFLLSILACLFIITAVSAQSEGLTISLSRDFGYGGFNGDIQGTFSIKASGPVTLSRVEFYLDDTLLGEDTSAPFALQFVTDNYPVGSHVLHAVGYTTDGGKIESTTISALFVSKGESNQTMLKMVVPILVIVFGAILVGALFPLISRKKGKTLPLGAARSYTFGGGICPKCHRPFAFQLLSLNMLMGKLTPCPHCGKWSIVRRATLNELHAAEQAEAVEGTTQIPELSEEEKLRKGLDDSRYQNM
jgi:hypothetical protein